MSRDDRDFIHVSPGEEALARRLDHLGALMRHQELAETEIDQRFARALRARLASVEETALPRGLTGSRGARPAPSTGRWSDRRVIAAAGTALAAVLVAATVAVVLLTRPQVPVVNAPYPTRADLVYSFPAPATVIRRLLPTVSLVHPRPGVPYAGRLRLGAGHLPTTSPNLHAYRLAYLSRVVVTGRRILRIRSSIHYVVSGAATWAVASEGGFSSRRPLHSLAMSLATGEVIYHDRRNFALPRAVRSAPRSAAVTVARRWLAGLGWPGYRMPLTGVETVNALPRIREVEFGWIGVGPTATDAATLWVTPNGSVVEAWAWPPVARVETIPSRSISAAWTEVRDGTLPLAVEGITPGVRLGGTGTVQGTRVVSVLSPKGSRTLYLVPTYRFEGRARIPGASVHTWYSLAPGAQR